MKKANPNLARKERKKRKRTALVICRGGTEFWTTQTQFWQWVRELRIRKTGDGPLTGTFNQPYEELMILVGRTVLNLAHTNHLREVVRSRSYMRRRYKS